MSLKSSDASSRVSSLLTEIVGPAAMADSKAAAPGRAHARASDIDTPSTDSPPAYSEVGDRDEQSEWQQVPAGSGPGPDERRPVPPAPAPDEQVLSESPQPPASAERARAPLEIKQTNSSITGDYRISNGKGPASPTVFLQSVNARIHTGLWFEDCGWQGPLKIQVHTTNGSLQNRIYTPKDRPFLDIKSSTTNGSNALYLPPDFHGVLLLKTFNGSINLSTAIQANAVRISGDSGYTCYELGGPDGADRAEMTSMNSKLVVSLTSDYGKSGSYAAVDASSGKSCVVM